MKMNELVCPISSIRDDNHTSRITALLTAVLTLSFVATQNPLPLLVAVIDLSLRAFGPRDWSPLRNLGDLLRRTLGATGPQKDLAPRTFAARLGMLLAALSIINFAIGFTMVALVQAIILLVLTLLDAVLDFCVGCYLYTHLVLPLYSRRSS